MPYTPNEPRLQRTFAGISAVALVALAVEWATLGADRLPSHVGTPESRQMPTALPGETLAVHSENFGIITTRPLFMEDRRPFRGAASGDATPFPASARPATRAEVMSLFAVVIAPQHQLALIQPGPNAPLQVLRPGEVISGWTVRAIRPYAVELEQQGESRTLDLEIRPRTAGSSPMPSATP